MLPAFYLIVISTDCNIRDLEVLSVFGHLCVFLQDQVEQEGRMGKKESGSDTCKDVGMVMGKKDKAGRRERICEGEKRDKTMQLTYPVYLAQCCISFA